MLVSTNVMAAQQTDPLLNLTFELNPLCPEEEVKVDQRIALDLLPVQVVYDAVSLATGSSCAWSLILKENTCNTHNHSSSLVYLQTTIFCVIYIIHIATHDNSFMCPDHYVIA